MSDQIKYAIDEKELVTETPKRNVADLLGEVGLTVEQAALVSQEGVEHGDPDETIELHDGDCFHVKLRDDKASIGQCIHYRVNGESQTAESNVLTVKEILERAGRAASVDVNDLSSYYLENMNDETKYSDLNDRLTLKDGDEFLAVHEGKTPVA